MTPQELKEEVESIILTLDLDKYKDTHRSLSILLALLSIASSMVHKNSLAHPILEGFVTFYIREACKINDN